MRYYYDAEFLEGTQEKKFLGFSYGKTKPTIDIISIGIVSEDGREYYAISKDFNLKEAWNRFDWKRKKVNDGIPGAYREYWIKENVLLPIYKECIYGDMRNKFPFTYSTMKWILRNYGKSNKQIAEEIVQFVDARWVEEGNISKGFMYPGGTSIKEVKTTNVQFYGYYSAYDHVALCWLFGRMIDLPKGFPKYTIDLKQILDEKVNSKKSEWGGKSKGF